MFVVSAVMFDDEERSLLEAVWGCATIAFEPEGDERRALRSLTSREPLTYDRLSKVEPWLAELSERVAAEADRSHWDGLLERELEQSGESEAPMQLGRPMQEVLAEARVRQLVDVGRALELVREALRLATPLPPHRRDTV
jgi:hypothetical protein